MIKNIKKWYMKLDNKFINKFPKWFRVSAPFIALLILWFDVSILMFTVFFSSIFNIRVHILEIIVRLFLYAVIFVFGPKQIAKIIKKLK